jgi:hypothetical protein
MASKAPATQYLDELSKKMCPDLHYFVVFSSIIGINGMCHSALEWNPHRF